MLIYYDGKDKEIRKVPKNSNPEFREDEKYCDFNSEIINNNDYAEADELAKAKLILKEKMKAKFNEVTDKKAIEGFWDGKTPADFLDYKTYRSDLITAYKSITSFNDIKNFIWPIEPTS